MLSEAVQAATRNSTEQGAGKQQKSVSHSLPAWGVRPSSGCTLLAPPGGGTGELPELSGASSTGH